MDDNIPDKTVYQSNRRRMCWVSLGCMVAMVSAIIYSPRSLAVCGIYVFIAPLGIMKQAEKFDDLYIGALQIS